jgi:hypothetical protein
MKRPLAAEPPFQFAYSHFCSTGRLGWYPERRPDRENRRALRSILASGQKSEVSTKSN